jgi:hypothetical protein
MSSDTTQVGPASPGSECRCAELALDLKRLAKAVDRVVDLQERLARARLVERLDAISPEQGRIRADEVVVVDHIGRERVKLYAGTEADDTSGVNVYDPVERITAALFSTVLYPHGEHEPGEVESSIALGVNMPLEIGMSGARPHVRLEGEGDVAPLLFGPDDSKGVPYHDGLRGLFSVVESHENVITAIHHAANLG